MSLPPFLNRIHDAAGPILGGISESELGQALESTALVLEIPEDAAGHPAHASAYLLASNLAARLYPRIGFDAPSQLRDQAVALGRQINPGLTIGPPLANQRTLTLSWAGGEASADRVTVAAKGWNLYLDGEELTHEPAEAPAALAAAALGIGELFRSLFAAYLDKPRTEARPFALNFITLAEPADLPPIPDVVEIGEVHLAGCGAIGQAAAATLRELPVRGTLNAVDHDPLDDGNLQRYVLAYAADVGSSKPHLIERAFADHPLVVKLVPTRWGDDERSAPGRQTVLSALDSKQGRIELQAGLHCELFNAWTHPAHIGVSRHQNFGGDAPCLACLSWPQQPRPSELELIADALQEDQLRVLRYLSSETPVGVPLDPAQLAPTGPHDLPEDAQAWAERALLDDLIERFSLDPAALQQFRDLKVGQLYRDGVCGGVLLRRGGQSQRQADLSIPLAHQSALAGILLATWLLVDRVPELRAHRPDRIVARYDVLNGGKQRWPRPREIEERCICRDPDYQTAYQCRWA